MGLAIRSEQAPSKFYVLRLQFRVAVLFYRQLLIIMNRISAETAILSLAEKTTFTNK